MPHNYCNFRSDVRFCSIQAFGADVCASLTTKSFSTAFFRFSLVACPWFLSFLEWFCRALVLRIFIDKVVYACSAAFCIHRRLRCARMSPAALSPRCACSLLLLCSRWYPTILLLFPTVGLLTNPWWYYWKLYETSFVGKCSQSTNVDSHINSSEIIFYFLP